MTVTNDNDGQSITQVDADAGQIEGVPDTTDVSDDIENQDIENQDADAEDDSGQDDDAGDQVAGGRRNREAGLRRRAQAAEAERDQLRAQLGTLHRQMVTDIATAAGLPEVELLESAGHEVSSFVGEDGTVDRAKVIEATRATVRRYNIRQGGLTPNQQQGMYQAPVSSPGVAGVIKEALGR